MSQIDFIKNQILKQLPDAQVLLRKSDDPHGFQILNIYFKGLEAVAEWRPDRGFGVSCFRSGEHDWEGLWDTPDEWYEKPEAVFHRLASLLIDEQTTKAQASSLSEIRQARGLSQTAVATELDVTQAAYSKLERRTDFKISSLKKLAEAMGGTLRVEIRFPDSREVREVAI